MNTEDTIDPLDTPIETCQHGEYGFRTSADRADSAALKQKLQPRADGCQRAAAGLHQSMVQHGCTPETNGSAGGSMQRGRAAIKTALTGNKHFAVFEESERAEDTALDQYRDCRDDDLASDVRVIIEKRFDVAQRNRAEIKALCD
jgi:uncharacterized protein (TIGR02284 family)